MVTLLEFHVVLVVGAMIVRRASMWSDNRSFGKYPNWYRKRDCYIFSSVASHVFKACVQG